MNKSEIEAKVAALLQPEGERKHDIKIIKSASRNIKGCNKCTRRWYMDDRPEELFCVHPDPITVCDDPEDKAAYEASMGKAHVLLQGLLPLIEVDVFKANRMLKSCGYLNGYGSAQDIYHARITRVFQLATPLQIWEIILKALK